jgi:hypothetical protein
MTSIALAIVSIITSLDILSPASGHCFSVDYWNSDDIAPLSDLYRYLGFVPWVRRRPSMVDESTHDDVLIATSPPDLLLVPSFLAYLALQSLGHE